MYDGKALYNPKGRAGEYGHWAINYFNGCSNGCEYCYLRRGVLSTVMGGSEATLKKCFTENCPDGRNPQDFAYEIGISEILRHKEEIIRDGGIFFSFSTDPCLDTTMELTARTATRCLYEGIPVIILTKCTSWIYSNMRYIKRFFEIAQEHQKLIAFGFTLTGHNELEPHAASNEKRIQAIKFLHERGYLTWASIEPVIDFPSSLRMIQNAARYCMHFKIGIRTDRKFKTSINETVDFINDVRSLVMETNKTVYWKQSIRDIIGGGFPIGYNFVEEGYNMFKYH